MGEEDNSVDGPSAVGISASGGVERDEAEASTLLWWCLFMLASSQSRRYIYICDKERQVVSFDGDDEARHCAPQGGTEALGGPFLA